MKSRLPLRHLPTRLATGGFILNAGLTKRGADEEASAHLHASAVAAYPFLKELQPREFVKLLSSAEMALGVALLLPFIPSALAGAALTAFSGGLLGLYLRTPGLRRDGGIRPSQDGTAIAKDVWMLGIGLSLLLDRD
jgi:hypothetical protein